ALPRASRVAESLQKNQAFHLVEAEADQMRPGGQERFMTYFNNSYSCIFGAAGVSSSHELLAYQPVEDFTGSLALATSDMDEITLFPRDQASVRRREVHQNFVGDRPLVALEARDDAIGMLGQRALDPAELAPSFAAERDRPLGVDAIARN